MFPWRYQCTYVTVPYFAAAIGSWADLRSRVDAQGLDPASFAAQPDFSGVRLDSDDFLGVNISPVASWYIVSTKLFDQLSHFATFPCIAFAPSILCHCSSFPHLNCRRIRQEPEPPPPPEKSGVIATFPFPFRPPTSTSLHAQRTTRPLKGKLATLHSRFKRPTRLDLTTFSVL